MPHLRAPRIALRSAGLIGLSCALHLLMLVAFPEPPPPREDAHQGLIWLELDAYAPATSEHARAPSEPREPVREPGPPLQRHEARARTAHARSTAELAIGAAPGPAPTPLPSAAPATTAPTAGPARAAATAQPPAPDLSPRSIALAALPPEPRAPVDDRAAQRSAELSAELNAAANARPFPRRAPPQLKRDPDGTCHYEGEAIAATILPDGGVQFEDKPLEVAVASIEPLAPDQLLWRGGVAAPPARPVTPEELVPEQRMEIRLKTTPRGTQAERDWFLRETVGLRRDLADATHAREIALATRDLRKRLERIWCDGTQQAAQRRRALFELWDETSDDELGEVGRDAIVDYIQLNLPPSSPDAYPPAQLAALNAGRAQRGTFDPYASARDR